MPRIISHLGFGLLIFFIGINHNYSVEKDFNLRVGEVKKFDNYQISFSFLEKENRKNYKAVVGNFTIINSNNNYSYIKLNPVTGRKHQLRKQLLLHGCPVLGDIKYNLSGNKKSRHLMLHAHKISFKINDIKYNFTAEPSKIFNDTIKEKYLKNYSL